MSLKENILSKVPIDSTKTKGLSKSLCLSVYLPSELTVNVDISDGLPNGTPCIIKNTRVHNSDRCSIVWVLFPDMKIGEKVSTKFRHLYNSTKEHAWTTVLELTRKFQFNYHKSFQITRRQLPITIAAAKTVHKSKGSTLQSAVIKFGDTKIDHIHIVALSRVQKLSTLFLYNLDDNKIKVSTAVENEMERLSQDRQKTFYSTFFRIKWNFS